MALLVIHSSQANAKSGIQHSVDGPLIELSEATLQAIDSGVSLTFICDYATIRPWLFMSWPEKTRQHRFVISKHALSDRYLVHQDEKPTPSIFRSSSQSMSYISKTANKLFRNYHSNNPSTQLRIYLNKYELPAPIRISAFTSQQWSFDSGWGLWQSAK